VKYIHALLVSLSASDVAAACPSLCNNRIQYATSYQLPTVYCRPTYVLLYTATCQATTIMLLNSASRLAGIVYSTSFLLVEFICDICWWS